MMQAKMKKIYRFGGSALSWALFHNFLKVKVMAAGPEEWANNSKGLVCVAGEKGDVATIQGFGCLIANASSVVFVILGLGGLLMITFAGVQYMLSGGNAQGVSKAKDSIKGVIIGFIILLASILILTIIKQVTGVDVTKITFPGTT